MSEPVAIEVEVLSSRWNVHSWNPNRAQLIMTKSSMRGSMRAQNRGFDSSSVIFMDLTDGDNGFRGVIMVDSSTRKADALARSS
jgi:hypothetical protein